MVLTAITILNSFYLLIQIVIAVHFGRKQPRRPKVYEYTFQAPLTHTEETTRGCCGKCPSDV